MFSHLRYAATLLLFGTVLFVPLTIADVFSAVDKIKSLFELETELLNKIGEYIKVQAEIDRGLEKEWVKKYKVLSEQHAEDTDLTNLTDNPINCYHFLRRFINDLLPLLEFIICEECEEWVTENAADLKRLRRKAMKSGVWPAEEDYNGAAVSLVRLSNVYALNLTNLLAGRIKGTQTQPITDDEIFHIVETVEEKHLSYECIQWLEAGLQRALSRRERQGAVRFYAFLATVYYHEDMVWKSLEQIQEGLRKFPGNNRLLRDLKYFKPRAEKIPTEKRTKKLKRTYRNKSLKKYERLCRERKGPYRDGLCRYKATAIPIYFVKEEILTRDPRIGMFHEVIFESEMEYIKKTAIDEMGRSLIVSLKSPVADMRISQSAWLRDDESDVIMRLTKRIELITGMSLTERQYSSDSESLQVLNYGIGGMYEPHFDYFGCSTDSTGNEIPMLAKSGDRLATWLFYLNDVAAGGSTVFPRANVRVPVIKGSAAFWFNLKRDTIGDSRTEHAGCPVLLGSKWVSNKWIRCNGNIFRFPCGLKPDSVYEL